MLTKTQSKILQAFAANITRNFSIADISRMLNMNYRAVHRAVKLLVNGKYLAADNKRYSLNYRLHHQELAYIEYLRSREILSKKKHGVLSLFLKDVMEKIEEDQFVLIIFGSTVSGARPRDADILLIVDSLNKVEPLERQLDAVADMFTLKFDIHVISHGSMYEMLGKRDRTNVINELLNRHIIVHGAETFYRMLAKGRG